MSKILAEAALACYESGTRNLNHDWITDGIKYKTTSGTDRARIWSAGRFMIIGFCGTKLDRIADIVADFGSMIQDGFPPKKGGRRPINVGRGFLEAYRGHLRDQVFDEILRRKPKGIYITGHSLGAALASLFFYDLLYSFPNPDWEIVKATNFGSPRVGDEAWKNDVNRVVTEFRSHKGHRNCSFQRVHASKDPITYIPKAIYPQFEHIGDKYLVDSSERVNPFYSHEMTHYLHHWAKIQ